MLVDEDRNLWFVNLKNAVEAYLEGEQGVAVMALKGRELITNEKNIEVLERT